MANDFNSFNSEFDSIGTTAAAPLIETPPAAPVSQEPAAPVEPVQTAEAPPAPPAEDPIPDPKAAAAALLAEFDNIDSEQNTQNADASDSSLSPGGAAPPAPNEPISSADTSQSQDKKPDIPDEAQTASEGEDAPDPTAPAGDAAAADDWTKNTPDEDDYIKKNLPEREWKNAQRAFREARMAKAYLNPNCPPEQFIQNLENKSQMRFSQVETAILKKNAEADPVEFLSKLFDATANEEGHSETYERLLDTLVDTNLEYVQHALEQKGLTVARGGEPGSIKPGEADLGADSSAVENLSDAEMDEFLESAVFTEMEENYPENAESIKKIFAAAKAAKAEIANTADERAKAKQAEVANQTEKQKADAEQQKLAEAQIVQTRLETFNNIYEENITSYVNDQLEKTLGLAVTPEEKAKNPMMAFLKEAKSTLIKAGGMNGTGDFDNDLYAWGKDRPAFVESSKSLVEYTKAGEKENARAAAQELKPFAEMFFSERLKMPEVALIDELIQIVARDQAARNEPHEDFPPTAIAAGASLGANSQKSILDDIDDIK